VQSYFTLDARLAWKPRDYLEFAIVGQNLLDDNHPENGSGIPIEVPRGLYGTVTVQW
jgi:iron complex outermembrane receptor protein